MLPRTADPQGFAHTTARIPARHDLTVVEPGPVVVVEPGPVVVLDLSGADTCDCQPPAPRPHRRGDFWPCPDCGMYWRLDRPYWWQQRGAQGAWGRVR